MRTQWIVILVKSVVPLYQMMSNAEWEQSGQAFKGMCEVLCTFETEMGAHAYWQSMRRDNNSPRCVD
jgi:hypothetical protein